MEVKEEELTNKELEVEKKELEMERKRLIEERWKFEEIMRELFEEEQKMENEDTDSDDEEDKFDQSRAATRGNSPYLRSPKPSTPLASPRPSSTYPEFEETVPLRSSRWHPQVGRAPAPNLKKARSTIDNKNDKYQPPNSARYIKRVATDPGLILTLDRRVEIFHDTEYLKTVKEARKLSAQPQQHRRHGSKTRKSSSQLHMVKKYFVVNCKSLHSFV